jgi:nitroreductase
VTFDASRFTFDEEKNMAVYDAIRTMLAVREYEQKPIPAEIVMRIVEAARLTGSSRNRQQWDFVVVRDEAALKRLGEMATHGKYIADAALAIAVVVPDGPVGYIDGTRAVQDMMLAAWGEGIGSNWVGNVNTDEIKTLLNAPADRMVLTIIPFGYPTKSIGAGIKERKTLGEIAHAERFGQPFSG